MELSQCKILFYLIKAHFNINLHLSPINKGSLSGRKGLKLLNAVWVLRAAISGKAKEGWDLNQVTTTRTSFRRNQHWLTTPLNPKIRPQGHQNPEPNPRSLILNGKKNLWISSFSIFYQHLFQFCKGTAIYFVYLSLSLSLSLFNLINWLNHPSNFWTSGKPLSPIQCSASAQYHKFNNSTIKWTSAPGFFI